MCFGRSANSGPFISLCRLKYDEFQVLCSHYLIILAHDCAPAGSYSIFQMNVYHIDMLLFTHLVVRLCSVCPTEGVHTCGSASSQD